jgi:hypothetical protein
VLRSFPSSLRGRILLAQLALFAFILFGLGVFQSSVLSDYLHETAVDSITQPARAPICTGMHRSSLGCSGRGTPE